MRIDWMKKRGMTLMKMVILNIQIPYRQVIKIVVHDNNVLMTSISEDNAGKADSLKQISDDQKQCK